MLMLSYFACLLDIIVHLQRLISSSFPVSFPVGVFLVLGQVFPRFCEYKSVQFDDYQLLCWCKHT